MLQINWTEKSTCFAMTAKLRPGTQVDYSRGKKKGKATSIKSSTPIRQTHSLLKVEYYDHATSLSARERGPPLNFQVKEVAAVTVQAPECHQVSHRGCCTCSVPVPLCLKLWSMQTKKACR